MRIALVGTVQGTAVALDALISSGNAPAVVLTLPPEAADRHSDFADVATPARRAGAEIVLTTAINSEPTLSALRAARPDLCLVLGWSQICGQAFRSIPRLGCVGFHPALLPRFRGRAVIPWTILKGETQTGSTLFWMDAGTDSGDILLQRAFPVAPSETARSLYDKHTANLKEMVPQAVGLIAQGTAPRLPQDHSKATYCAKRTPGDGVVDWGAPATGILRLIRAVGEPYPGAFTECDGELLFIDDAVAFVGSGRYIGLAGQVQDHTPGGFVVLCGDGECLEVRRWRMPGGRRPPRHVRLGRRQVQEP